MFYMYNTIEVNALEIYKADIKYLKSGGLSSETIEGVKHVKILPFLSIVQATEGSYDISLGNGPTMQTGEGGFFVAPAHIKQTIVHHVNPKSRNMNARWLFLDVEINESHKLDAYYRFPVVINDASAQKLNELFDVFWESEHIWARYSACYKMLEVLMSHAEAIERTKHEGIFTAMTYMTENITQQFTISDLAKVARMSKSNFYAAFKRQFGISPISYINHYRLSVAAEKLSETDLPVKEIACAVGINDALYFSKLFKNEYGISPREYRLNHKNETELVK